MVVSFSSPDRLSGFFVVVVVAAAVVIVVVVVAVVSAIDDIFNVADENIVEDGERDELGRA